MADTAHAETTKVKLQVASAQGRDVGKGTARVSSQALDELGLRPGGIIEILGKKSAAAIALPPYQEDEGLSIIRLDGLERANANVRIGDQVEIRKADVSPARKVSIAPAQQNVQLTGPGEALRRTLHMRPLIKGNVISTSVYRRSPEMDQRQFPEELFRSFFQQQTFGLQANCRPLPGRR